MNIPTFAAASESVIRCKEPIKSAIQFGSISNNFFGNNVAMTKGTLAAKKIPDINAQLNEPSKHYITIKGNASVIIHCLDESCDANKSLIQFGSLSNFVGHHSKKDEDIIVTKTKKQVQIIPKPRTALIQEEENDEPMDHQVISKKTDENCSNVINKFTIQFGSFLCELKESNMKKGNVVSDTSMASRLIFERTNLFKYKRKMKSKSFILIGAMHVEVPS